MKNLKSLLLATLTVALTACGSDDDRTAICEQQTTGVNWQALLDENCEKLSAYHLFESPSNPTIGVAGAMPYALSTPLFSEYASKYRLIYMPEGTQATFHATEAFDFPVGTVIAKTFALPDDTASRGLANETLIETRLMIHREAGWIGLPYIWNEAQDEASLAIAGGSRSVSIIHKGQTQDFTYQIPDMNTCKQCHQFNDENHISRITLIGPKARFLNSDFTYPNETTNQLTHWQAEGLLTGLPDDLNSVLQAPVFEDLEDQVLSELSDETLESYAKAYLDINCAHCHRPEGGASNTGLHMEYWRDIKTDINKFGICKKPVAFGGGSLSFDITPGGSAQSILLYRLETTKAGDKMPEIARNITHEEGVELIRAWIDRLGNSHSSCN
ncbi:MAG: hypothetical protein HRU20_10120 [Pseudomonadales bacterium]|nr:hypothetical protein [Pseudomonadales bacterium]